MNIAVNLVVLIAVQTVAVCHVALLWDDLTQKQHCLEGS